jgi:hypothetical protein
MEKTTFNLTTFSGSTPMRSDLYDNKKYSILDFVEEERIQSGNEFDIAYPNFIEFRTAYWTQNLPLNINLEINFDDIERRKFLFDLNAEIKDKR